MGRHATFSPEQATAILRDPRSVAEIAAAYGVSAPLIYKVKAGDAISTASTAAEAEYFKEWNRVQAEKLEAQAKKHRDFIKVLEADWPSGQG